MKLRHLWRMSRLARKPSSARRVKLFAAVLVLCLVLFGIERLVGWPDWMTMPNARTR